MCLNQVTISKKKYIFILFPLSEGENKASLFTFQFVPIFCRSFTNNLLERNGYVLQLQFLFLLFLLNPPQLLPACSDLWHHLSLTLSSICAIWPLFPLWTVSLPGSQNTLQSPGVHPPLPLFLLHLLSWFRWNQRVIEGSGRNSHGLLQGADDNKGLLFTGNLNEKCFSLYRVLRVLNNFSDKTLFSTGMELPWLFPFGTLSTRFSSPL